MSRSNIIPTAALGVLLSLAAACSTSDGAAGPNAARLSLSFSTAAKRSPSAVGGVFADFTQTVGSNTLLITKA